MLTEKKQTKKDSMMPLESSCRKCITIMHNYKDRKQIKWFPGYGGEVRGLCAKEYKGN